MEVNELDGGVDTTGDSAKFFVFSRITVILIYDLQRGQTNTIKLKRL